MDVTGGRERCAGHMKQVETKGAAKHPTAHKPAPHDLELPDPKCQ